MSRYISTTTIPFSFFIDPVMSKLKRWRRAMCDDDDDDDDCTVTFAKPSNRRATTPKTRLYKDVLTAPINFLGE